MDAETKTKTKTNGGEAEPPTSTFPPTPEDIISSGAAEPTPVSGKTVVAFGLTVREISLEPDARAAYDDAMDTQGAEAGQSRPINRWIGQKCRELEKAVLRSDGGLVDFFAPLVCPPAFCSRTMQSVGFV